MNSVENHIHFAFKAEGLFVVFTNTSVFICISSIEMGIIHRIKNTLQISLRIYHYNRILLNRILSRINTGQGRDSTETVLMTFGDTDSWKNQKQSKMGYVMSNCCRWPVVAAKFEQR